MKSFSNPNLAANNVMTTPLADAIVRDIKGVYAKYFRKKSPDIHVAHPPWQSDISWVSANTLEMYKQFDGIFNRMKVASLVAPYLDLQEKPRLYMGFFVVRSLCTQPDFHFDWQNTNNEAFTLLTPVSDNGANFGLLYRKADGDIGEYKYKAGEAIIFGDNFYHSTKPGRSEQPVVLLSFTFGTDKAEHTDNILKNIGTQSNLIRLPNGTFLVRNFDK